MSPVFDCTTDHGRADAIPKAAAGVREGGLVVLPTDTLYGIGADAFSPEAVRALLAAKGRGSDMPPPVLVPDARTVDGLATEVPDYARALVAAFWPGPLTIVLRAQPSLMWDLGETGGTVALRMPDDPVALELLREVGPMAVSSANRTGYPASRTVVEAASQLGAAVEFYLDGGPVTGGLASTIVDCTRDEPVFLRVGAIAEADVMDVVERARADALELNAVGPEPTEGSDEPESPVDAEHLDRPPRHVENPDEPRTPPNPETPSSERRPTMTDTFYGSDFGALEAFDPDIAGVLLSELDRLRGGLQLIASENFSSPEVLTALGSTLSNKYAEGYPGRRYYGGCSEVDKAELLAIERCKALFEADHANVQAHSGPAPTRRSTARSSSPARRSSR